VTTPPTLTSAPRYTVDMFGVRDLRRCFPAARSLARDDAERLLALGAMEEHPIGTVLFEEGAPATGLHLLLEGVVEVGASLAEGDPVPLGRLAPGEVLGEMGLIENAPRSGRAVAATRVRTLALDREAYRTLAQTGDPLACWLLDVIARGLARRVSSMTARVAYARLQPERAHAVLQDRLERTRRWWEILGPRRRSG